MTNRVQIFRTPTTGVAPAAGTRLSGELWVNLADFQLGVIDAAKNAQKLVAVRYFSAAAAYVAGDFVIQAGALYAAKGAVPAGAFNAAQWTQIGAATDAGGPYLALAGGTLTGALTLAADPGAALGAATKQYVDGKVSAAPFLPLAGGTMLAPIVLSGPPTLPLQAATKAYVDAGAFVPIGGGTMTGDLILNRDAQLPLGATTKQQVDARGPGDNRLINGDMRIDQRNNGATGTANGVYTVDRWKYNATQASKGTWGRASGPSSIALGFPYYLNFTSSSAYTPLTADNFCFLQFIEADMVSDFAWGTANAQPVTLSFWANATVAGTYSGSIRNDTGNRSYPFSFPLAGTGLQKIVITIPGDTGGTWVMNGNAAAMIVAFDFGAGATFRGPANAWAATNYTGVTGATSIVANNGATFALTGVKLEIGSVATPYNRQSLAKSWADCQRYYQTGQLYYSTWSGAVSQGLACSSLCPVSMRATATMAVATDSSSASAGARTLGNSGNCFYVTALSNAVNSATLNVNFTASAEL